MLHICYIVAITIIIDVLLITMNIIDGSIITNISIILIILGRLRGHLHLGEGEADRGRERADRALGRA